MSATESSPVEAVQDIVVDERRLYRTAKRLFDLAICAFVALIGLLPFLLISIAIRLTSPGPILFVQERVGKNGRPFRMFKFRTMREGGDDEAERAYMRRFVSGDTQPTGSGGYKPINQARITRIGALLRRTSLDELPNIINVLRHEMSLVGPRPNVPWEVEVYREWHRQRLHVLPGMTGLAQVRGRSNLPFDTIVQYDLEYIQRQTFKLDLEILWATLGRVVKRDGAG
jgi:lipopolysaccharide/colanic/teichoic acid biosynthesis glycosyltransferase